MELMDKVAMITGASSGIGAATAKALAAEGVKVALLARRREPMEATAGEIGDSGEVLIQPTDLRDEAALLAAFKAVDERFGRLDILINNAGLARPVSLHDGESEAFREMWEVNVHALTIATREALARFPEEGGHLVNISSMSGHRVPPGGGGAFYSATKFAVRALTEGVRAELRARKSRSRVTAVSPGFVETNFFNAMYGDPARGQEVLDRFDKMLQPEDIAAQILHTLKAPPHVSIHDILLRPTEQSS